MSARRRMSGGGCQVGAQRTKMGPLDPTQAQRDAEDLGRFGYAQQLLRRMGGFGNFALSFSIISILTGAVTQYTWGLSWGGAAGVVGGRPLGSVMGRMSSLRR